MEAESCVAGASSHTVEQRRAEILSKILQTLTDVEDIWSVLSEEQQSCCVLILKQTFLSARFSDFDSIWKEIDFTDREDLVEAYLQVNLEVNRVGDFLTQFENRTQKTAAILREATETYSQRIGELNRVRELCMRAQTEEELEALRIPNFSTITVVPYPDVDEMCREWEAFDLDGKLDSCFEALELLN